jgi:hypothetical protein
MGFLEKLRIEGVSNDVKRNTTVLDSTFGSKKLNKKILPLISANHPSLHRSPRKFNSIKRSEKISPRSTRMNKTETNIDLRQEHSMLF